MESIFCSIKERRSCSSVDILVYRWEVDCVIRLCRVVEVYWIEVVVEVTYVLRDSLRDSVCLANCYYRTKDLYWRVVWLVNIVSLILSRSTFYILLTLLVTKSNFSNRIKTCCCTFPWPYELLFKLFISSFLCLFSLMMESIVWLMD